MSMLTHTPRVYDQEMISSDVYEMIYSYRSLIITQFQYCISILLVIGTITMLMSRARPSPAKKSRLCTLNAASWRSPRVKGCACSRCSAAERVVIPGCTPNRQGRWQGDPSGLVNSPGIHSRAAVAE